MAQFHVFLRKPGEDACLINVSPTDTPKDVKSGHGLVNVRMYLNSKYLKDSMTLVEQGVKSTMTLNVVNSNGPVAGFASPRGMSGSEHSMLKARSKTV